MPTAVVRATAMSTSRDAGADSAESCEASSTRFTRRCCRGSQSPLPEPTTVHGREPGVLHPRVGATWRAGNRADALVSITHVYLHSDRPARAPVEVMTAIPRATCATAQPIPSMSAAWAMLA